MPTDQEVGSLLGVNCNNYGTYGRSNGVVSPAGIFSPRVIYCVHGKPSAGCCKVLEGELLDIFADDDIIATHAKENTDTTELSTL
ncbi:hypothetical protein NQ318_012897 [Aromia moschata]|uniref:Reverse transcriptase domain-containing protein n=1 Tax=Aromia moschata TaxID=1265417 RepID=A0AAV8YE70_9CUCU|nr:hypothetical protein NQ318_012897 [Aromia moschata]